MRFCMLILVRIYSSYGISNQLPDPLQTTDWQKSETALQALELMPSNGTIVAGPQKMYELTKFPEQRK